MYSEVVKTKEQDLFCCGFPLAAGDSSVLSIHVSADASIEGSRVGAEEIACFPD